MDRILVLSHGTHTCAREALPHTKAIVTNGMESESSRLYAEIFRIPFLEAQHVFRLSPQSVRYSATRLAVLEQGVAVYEPLEESWLRRSNWPCARGNAPAILTAYLLARMCGTSSIDCRLAHRDEVIEVSVAFRMKLQNEGIELRYYA